MVVSNMVWCSPQNLGKWSNLTWIYFSNGLVQSLICHDGILGGGFWFEYVKLLSLVFSGFSAAKKKTAPWIGHFIGESCKASKNWFCWRCLWRLMMNEVTLGTQWFKRLFIRHHEGARKLQSLHQDLQNSGKDQGSAVGIESSLSFCLSYWWFLG